MNREYMLNSELEFGFRALIVLIYLEDIALDLDELLLYDYLLTNAGEFDCQVKSIHANTPYRYSKLLVKRNVLKKGINSLCKYGLVDILFDNNGIKYTKSKFSKGFLENIDSTYKDNLIIVAKWIKTKIVSEEIIDIKKELEARVRTYGVEFYSETNKRWLNE